MVLQTILFSSEFSTKTLYMPLLSQMLTTCPANHIFDFVTRMKFVEENIS
jgi:hypothetical protein